jgi:CubicO group peptidase (beta-lactamase class C family)
MTRTLRPNPDLTHFRRRIACLSYTVVAGLTLLLPVRDVAGQSKGTLDSLTERLATYMKPYTEMRDFSGRILVAYRGAVVLDSAFMAPGDGVSAPDTRFGIGSVTKTFTAAAVCLLAERGKLRLSDSLGKYIPELSAGKRATIQQTLGHAAGIPDYYTQPDYPRLRSHSITLEKFAKWIGTKPLDFEPGTREAYSNSGYALLALVVERVSGRPYARFVEEELLRPAGLQSTGQLTAVTGSLAPGHDPAPAPRYIQVPKSPDLSWLAGSGSMYSTTGDLLRWVTALRSDRVLAFSKLPYAYGWHVEGDSILEQNGRIPAGYTTQLTEYPKQDLTIVILSAIQADVVGRIKDDIAAMVLGRPYRVPAMRTVITLSDSVASRVVGTYEFGPGFDVRVRRGHGSLELAGPEGDFFPLDPVGQARFFFRPVYVPVRFERDSAGRDVLIWNGEARAARVPPH